jgi:hypothetical protein
MRNRDRVVMLLIGIAMTIAYELTNAEHVKRASQEALAVGTPRS